MNLLPAIMRTGVPIVYAFLIHLGLADLLVSLGMPADNATAAVTYIAGVLLAVLLYVVLRELERLQPKIGVLLGWVGAPQYGTAVSTVLADSTPGIVAELESLLGAHKDAILAAIEAKLAPKPAPAPAPAPAAKRAPVKPAAKKAAAPVKKAPAKRPAAKKAAAPASTNGAAK